MEVILSKDLEKELTKKEFTVLEVYADWCGPCKMLKPVLEEISKTMKDVNFITLNSDNPENRDFLNKEKVSSIPTVFYFKNNKLVLKHVGFLSAEGIIENINQTRTS